MEPKSRMAEQAAIDEQSREAYRARYSAPGESLRLAEAAAARAEGIGYTRGLGYALRTMGAAHCMMSDLNRAESDLRRAQEIFTDLNDELGLAHVLLWLGNLDSRRISFAAALEKHLFARERFHALGDREGEISVLHMIGVGYRHLQDFGKAVESHLESKRMAEEIADGQHLAMSLINLAIVYGEEGEHSRSLDLFRAALEIASAMGDSTTAHTALANIGTTLRRLGKLEEALEHSTKSLAAVRQQGLRRLEIDGLMEIGEIHHARGDHEAALQAMQAAVRLSEAVGERTWAVFAQVRLGEAFWGCGDITAAEQTLLGALQGARITGLITPEYEAHRALSGVYEAQGDTDAALRHHKAFHAIEARAREAEAESRRRERHAVEEVERVRREAELQAATAELQLLKAQLQPHFLYNALGSIATLMHRDVAAADQMIVRLSDLLRLALHQSSQQHVSLAQELDFVSRYVEVEKVRHQGSIHLEVEAEPKALGAEVPHLILQPLVENAIHHGMVGERPRLLIRISGRFESDNMLRISVEDDGAGMSGGGTLMRMGVGVRNTGERLRRLYGTRQRLQISPGQSGGTIVSVVLPLRMQSDAGSSR